MKFSTKVILVPGQRQSLEYCHQHLQRAQSTSPCCSKTQDRRSLLDDKPGPDGAVCRRLHGRFEDEAGRIRRVRCFNRHLPLDAVLRL